MSEPKEVLENAIAELQLIAYNGGIASLSINGARALADELERCCGYERAYKALLRDYDTLVSGVHLELDEQADCIADLLEQLKQTVDALTYWFPRWGDPEGARSQMMTDARVVVAKRVSQKSYNTVAGCLASRLSINRIMAA